MSRTSNSGAVGVPAVGPKREWVIPARPRRGRKPNKTPLRGKMANKQPATRGARQGPLKPDVREAAALKRRSVGGVCVWCHHKKSSCSTDKHNPDEPCRNCRIHNIPCLAYRVTDTALYREQHAPYHLFSQRWESMAMVDITQWASQEVLTIRISQLFLDAPYEVRVRRFVPLPGDMLEQRWADKDEMKTFPIPPYGIINMTEAADSIGRMIEQKMVSYIRSLRVLVGAGDHDNKGLIWGTYSAAFNRASSKSTPEEEKALLLNTLRLWISCRLTSHPEHLVSEEKLGMRKVQDPTSPHNDRVPIPPVLGAQLECILYTRFLRPLSKRVLEELLAMIQTRGRRHWMTVYMVMFMMLHSCSLLTRRDMEYAAQLKLPTRFCNKEAILKQHAGAKTLLAHFHQGLKGNMPFQLSLESRLQDCVDDMSSEDMSFINASAKRADACKLQWARLRNKPQALTHDFYWTSQLFDNDWKPDRMD
ncbi:unnamed protein product [Discula destructiva]